jgi:Tfp pilus assembly protein PilF
MGDNELALRRYEQALAVDPYHPMSNIELAESLAAHGRYAEAACRYLCAARLGPYGTAVAYNMAGECFRKAGEQALAEDCFMQTLRVDPYAVSAARGWRDTATALADVAREYADQLHEWGTQRRAAKTPVGVA